MSGNSVTVLVVGASTIAADQTADSGFTAASHVVQSFSVTAAGTGGGGGDISTSPERGS